MDGDVLSLTSFSSLPASSAAGTQKDTQPTSDSSLPQNQQEHKPSEEELWYVRSTFLHTGVDTKTGTHNGMICNNSTNYTKSTNYSLN